MLHPCYTLSHPITPPFTPFHVLVTPRNTPITLYYLPPTPSLLYPLTLCYTPNNPVTTHRTMLQTSYALSRFVTPCYTPVTPCYNPVTPCDTPVTPCDTSLHLVTPMLHPSHPWSPLSLVTQVALITLVTLVALVTWSLSYVTT